MNWLRRQQTLFPAIPLAFMVNACWAGTASAHVKWFCAYNVGGAPRGLENVLCPDFELLFGVTILALMSGCLVEGTPVGAAMLRSLDRVTGFLKDNTENLFRAGTAFFFISIWAVGGFMLTPELKTTSVWFGVLHLGIAAGMLSRRTMPLSALGIVVIFMAAIWQYGAFHLADYPVFLGIAAYLALTGAQRDFFGIRALDIVRWSAGITLMWASVEKWAYPQWTLPLLEARPEMTFGFDPDFFMRAAGAVEFALAFALIWTPLVRRFSAIILAAMFIAAVAEFGKIDLVGHTMIVVVLFAIIGDNRGASELVKRPWLVPVGYAAALGAFLGIYYVAHSVLFGSPLA